MKREMRTRSKRSSCAVGNLYRDAGSASAAVGGMVGPDV